MKKNISSRVWFIVLVSFLMLTCGACTPAEPDKPDDTELPGNPDPNDPNPNDPDDPNPNDPGGLELVGEEFVPTASETARPGVGIYADYDILPIRGEYITSKNNFTPISFPSGEYVGYDGKTASTRKAFRMWFVIKKGTEFTGTMTYINLKDGGDYRLGSHIDEVANTLGEGSLLGAGNPGVPGNIMGTQAHFPDDADNELYDIYFCIWDVNANRAMATSPTGNYDVNFYIEPRILEGNTGADIPEGKIYLECPVTISVVPPSGTGGEPGESGDFLPEDYAGCTTQSFTYTSKNLRMAVDIPSDRTEKTPFIIYATGGSWTGGSVGAFENQSKYLATRGIAGVRLMYSFVKDGGTLQIGYDEMREAYEFVAAKAEELNLDITRFGYCGGSAGCTIAAYATMTLPECDLYLGCNGLYDLINLQENNFPARNDQSMLYLAPYTQEQLSAMSPIRNIPTTDTPAVALFHGTNDITINYQRSVDFANAVEAAGGRADMHLYEGLGHGFFNRTGSGGAFKDVTLKMYEFARQVFEMTAE